MFEHEGLSKEFEFVTKESEIKHIGEEAHLIDQEINIYVEKEWRKLYPYVWCDFYRFLKGWSPGHYKLNSYSEQMKNKVLEWI